MPRGTRRPQPALQHGARSGSRCSTARTGARTSRSMLVGTTAMGALVPLVGPLDERLFLAVNSLGDGPDWLFAIVDPHTRNYAVMGLVAVAAAALRDRRLAPGLGGGGSFCGGLL